MTWFVARIHCTNIVFKCGLQNSPKRTHQSIALLRDEHQSLHFMEEESKLDLSRTVREVGDPAAQQEVKNISV